MVSDQGHDDDPRDGDPPDIGESWGGRPAADPADKRVDAAPPRRFRRVRWVIHKAWWIHSFFALAFGVGVMLFARRGLAYADKLLMVLGASWLLMFVALRFIVGRQNRRENEHVARKGVRLLTNYVIKQLYQQMFFFLVPMYASSATWSLASVNWWLAPVLLVFAVVSTLDLVFDNFIMERRVLASTMYGVAMFGVLNLMLPVVVGLAHFPALVIAAGVTAPAVALLSFPARAVVSARGFAIVLVVSTGMVVGVWFGRSLFPPTPLAMSRGAVGHGTLSSYECMPGEKRVVRVDRLDGLRCGSRLAAPGGLNDPLLHVWTHEGRVVSRLSPVELEGCDGLVFRSYLNPTLIPDDPLGDWTCRLETEYGQLVGLTRFRVEVAPQGSAARPPRPGTPDAGIDGAPDASPVRDADTGDATRTGADAQPDPAPDAALDAGAPGGDAGGADGARRPNASTAEARGPRTPTP